MIELSKIRIDGGTQARAELNQETVAEYAEAYRAGVQMPPIVLFYDGATYWLADGFHRFFGAKAAGIETIHEEVTPGSQRDAVLFSLGANAKHGLRRSNADKRKAVQMLLNDAEWASWSQEKVAGACGVSAGFVSKLVHELASLHGEEIKPMTRTVERNGQTYQQNTASIGKAPAAPAKPAVVAASAPETAKPATIDGACERIADPGTADQPELEELREFCDTQGQTIKELLAENESMARVFDANNQVAAALAEVARFRAMNTVLESRVTGLMNELAEIKRRLKIAQRRAERAEAAHSKEAAQCKPT